MIQRSIIIGGCIAGFLVLFAWFLPLPAAVSGEGMPESTRILDRTGKVLYEVQGSGYRSDVPLQNMPQTIVDALLSTEDRTFYAHPGLSLRGIARAALRDLQAGQIVEGGSTISQQLVRTSLQPKHRGFLYKLREAWLALKLDAHFSKDEILERYLNMSYFGQGAYGINAASKIYFDTDISHLSTGQSALLVGLLNAPSSLNPFKDPVGAKARRDLVLRAMRSQGKITEEEFATAIAEPVNLSSGRTKIRAPHFVLWILQQHPEFTSKSDIPTTLDLDLQTVVEDIVNRHVEKLKEKNVTSAAVVVLDARTGEILSIVGSSDYFDVDHDGAVNVAIAARQPGSALKPFTYALALSDGMTAASTVADIETQFFTEEGNPYIPRNYDFGYHGLVRIREALANSYNIAAVKILERVGVGRLLSLLTSAGLSTLNQSPEHYGLALTLGDSEVTLLELTSAYGAFARGGETLSAKALPDETVKPSQRILSPDIAWLITDILSDADARAAEFGRDGPLNFPYPVAAKTGTTRNSRDNWTIGYTPDRIVGVWVGNADNSPMRGTSGVTGAGPIFHDVMQEATKFLDPKPFVRPPTIIDTEICRLSGKLPTSLCTDVIVEHFIAGTQPNETDDMMVSVSIDTRTGLRAGDSCPEQYVKKEIFAVFPPEVRKWARENGWATPPGGFSPLCPSSTDGSVSNDGIVITRPGPESSFLLDPLIPDEQEEIVFEARADAAIRTLNWSINGKMVGQGKAPDFRYKWRPTPGSFTIQASSGSLHHQIHIDVRK